MRVVVLPCIQLSIGDDLEASGESALVNEVAGEDDLAACSLLINVGGERGGAEDSR